VTEGYCSLSPYEAFVGIVCKEGPPPPPAGLVFALGEFNISLGVL
jgi:hypothetical protein